MVMQNRICRPVSASPETLVAARNLAELLCDLGVVLRRRMRRGAGTDCASLPLELFCWESNLALGFVSLRASVQLRAMVEDWPLQRIQEVVHAQRLETLRPQEECARRAGPRRRPDLESKRAGFTHPGFLIWLAACVFAAALAAALLGGHL